MADVIKIKKGLDLKLNGVAELVYGQVAQSETYGFVPDDFHGLVPKPALKPGDAVKVGTVLFTDKNHPEIKVVSPVSGELLAVNRGERRKILDIVIKNDGKMEQADIAPVKADATAEEMKEGLSNAGMLAFIKQRPYDVIANPSDTPRAIFISTFDKAPLAPDYDFIFKDEQSDFQSGVDALSKIAPVYVGVAKGNTSFAHLRATQVTCFDGKYPVSNVGVQINHVAPINKGEIVWTIGAQEVVYIGRYVSKGKLDFTRTVALTGDHAIHCAYYKMLPGTPYQSLLQSNVQRGEAVCTIAGNPLCGEEATWETWLSPFTSQITVLKDGKGVHELLGWIMPRFDKFSMNGSFLSGLCSCLRKKTYKYDTRILGGHRQMIMSGEYEKVFPMDIFPEQLIKAIIAGDIDRMEALGIYEVAPEDFAAAEFVCSSKMELQRIVREGLDKLRKEMC